MFMTRIAFTFLYVIESVQSLQMKWMTTYLHHRVVLFLLVTPNKLTFWYSFETTQIRIIFYNLQRRLSCGKTHKICFSKWFPNMFTETVLSEKCYKKSVGNIVFVIQGKFHVNMTTRIGQWCKDALVGCFLCD